MRYAGRDTLTAQMRETSDSKFVHNLATGLDLISVLIDIRGQSLA